MFENPRKGRQARNFTKHFPKILDLKLCSEQIFSENWCWVPLIYYSTQREGPPVRGPLFDFWAGDGLFFSTQDFFRTLFVQQQFCFARNVQTLMTILIYKNFFGPLGASAYVMVGPERYHHLHAGLLPGRNLPSCACTVTAVFNVAVEFFSKWPL